MQVSHMLWEKQRKPIEKPLENRENWRCPVDLKEVEAYQLCWRQILEEFMGRHGKIVDGPGS